jgi:uncharacterized membrane protein
LREATDMTEAVMPPSLETAVSHWLKPVGVEILAAIVIVIVIGLAWSTYLFLRRQMAEEYYGTYKIRIDRSLLLGLEVVVAADIVKTIAVEPSLTSLAVLGGLVVIRTFLSSTLVLEIEGRWPWRRDRHRPSGADHAVASAATASAYPVS